MNNSVIIPYSSGVIEVADCLGSVSFVVVLTVRNGRFLISFFVR